MRKTKKMLAFLLVLCMVVSILPTGMVASAASPESDFTTTNDGTYVTITGYTGEGGDVEIPAIIGGLQVTTIAKAAFKDKTLITSVVIPEGVGIIDNNAFSGCTNLESVTIPSTVNTLGGTAFYQCKNLKTVTIPSAVYEIKSGAFYGCTSLESVTIEDGVEKISTSAFNGCTSLTSVTIPESVINIATNAFTGHGDGLTIYGVTGSAAQTFADANSIAFVSTGDDTTAPKLTAGAVSRESDTAATVKFTSSEAGNYYYEVVDAGAEAPAVDTEGDGTACDTKEQTISLATLTSAGAKDIYIAAKDAAGNVSDALKITIPLYDEVMMNFEYTTDDTGVTITKYKGAGGAVVIPAEIEGKPVTKIAGSAFYNKAAVTSVVIPSSVTAIDGSAFSGCSGLTSVTIPEGVTTIGQSAFDGCSQLESVTVPDSVTTIGDDAFSGCGALSSVTLGSGITSIGNGVFKNCTSLQSIEIPDGVTSIGMYAFLNCTAMISVTIPASVTTIADTAFSGHSGSLTIYGAANSKAEFFAGDNGIAFEAIDGGDTAPTLTAGAVSRESDAAATVKFTSDKEGEYYYEVVDDGAPAPTIDTDGAGTDCDTSEQTISLTELTAGAKDIYIVVKDADGNESTPLKIEIADFTEGPVEETPAEDFTRSTDASGITITGYNGTATDIVIPAMINGKPVIRIGNLAFYNKTALTSVVIPEGVTTLVEGAFYGCTNLNSVTIPSSVTSIETSAFQDCSSLTSVTIPDGVTSISNNTFYGCTNLKSVTIPSTVISIGTWALRNCAALESVDIPESVTSIGDNAFEGCETLASVTVPATVTNVGKNLFQNCAGLTSVTIQDGVTGITEDMFYGCTSLGSIEIPGSVASVGRLAFYGCTSLTSVTIGEGTTGIADGAFSGCTGLESITIPSSVATIGNNVFYNHSADLTIHGANGSYAQSYATANSIKFEATGEVVTCTLTYDANGGEGTAPEGNTYNSGDIVTVASGNGLTKTDCTFAGWNTKSDGSGTSYAAGGTFHIATDTTLYAQWATKHTVSVSANPAEGGTVTGGGSYADHAVVVVTATAGDDYLFVNWTENGTEVSKNASYDFFMGKADRILVANFTKRGFITTPYLTGVKITGYTGTAADLVIPAEIDGKPVLYIGSSAFIKNKTIQSVVIPDSVDTIGSYAFAECTKLKSLTLGNASNQLIGDNAFYGCTSLETVAIPDGVTKTGYSVFQNCTSLSSVTLGSGLTEISSAMFKGCTSLTSITIPVKVRTIGSEAFANCTALTDVTIPAGVTKILYGAFDGHNVALIIHGTAGSAAETYATGNSITFAPVAAPDPTVTGVTVFPDAATVEKGKHQTFVATVTGTGDFDDTVTWSVTGGVTGTAIDASGQLTVAANETATTLTVTATANGDNNKKGTATVTVTDADVPDAITGVTVFPATATVKKGEIESFTATVTGTGDFDDTVIWSVTGGVTGTAIDESGLLIVADDETAATLTVTATANGDNSKKGTAIVTVTDVDVPVSITGVTVSPATATVKNGEDQAFTAIVTGTGDFDDTVTWSVTGGVTGTAIDESGLLTVAADETATTLTVTAIANGDNSKKDTATVTVTETAVTKYTLTVIGGTGSGEYEEEALLTITADPAPEDQVFDQWVVTSGTLVLDDKTANPLTFAMPAQDIEIKATYKDKPGEPISTYTVTFDTKGGSISHDTMQTGTDGKLASLPAPTRKNYRFDGWFTAANGGTKVTSSTVFRTDTTVYAHWTYTGGSGGNGGGSSSGGGSPSGSHTVVVSGQPAAGKPVVSVQTDPQGNPVVTVGASPLTNANPLTAAEIAQKAANGTLNETVNPNGVWDGKTTGANNVVLVIDTKEATLAPSGSHRLGVSTFAGPTGYTLRVRASRDGFVTITANADGTYAITALRPVSDLFILVEILDASGNVVGHSSMKLNAAVGLTTGRVENKAATIA